MFGTSRGSVRSSAPWPSQQQNPAVGQGLPQMQQDLPPGFTRNPITGQVFRIQPPRARSAAFAELERHYDALRSELVGRTRELGLVYLPLEKKYRTHDGKVADEPSQLRDLIERVNIAREAVKAYRHSHAEEFVPITGRRNRNLRNQRRMERRLLEQNVRSQQSAALQISAGASLSSLAPASSLSPTAISTPIVVTGPQTGPSLEGKTLEMRVNSLEDKLNQIIGLLASKPTPVNSAVADKRLLSKVVEDAEKAAKLQTGSKGPKGAK